MTRIDLDPGLASWLRPHAERSAEPHPDREPERRNLPPAPPAEPTKDTRPNPDAFPEAAVETWRAVEQLREQQAGTIALPVGYQPDGTKAPGAHDDWYDTPQANPDDHHQFPLVVGDLLMWQQGPAMHCAGAVFGHAASNYARQCIEAESARRYLASVLVSPDVSADSIDAAWEALTAARRKRLERRIRLHRGRR